MSLALIPPQPGQVLDYFLSTRNVVATGSWVQTAFVWQDVSGTNWTTNTLGQNELIEIQLRIIVSMVPSGDVVDFRCLINGVEVAITSQAARTSTASGMWFLRGTWRPSAAGPLNIHFQARRPVNPSATLVPVSGSQVVYKRLYMPLTGGTDSSATIGP